jgi:hypothetical protein
MLKKWESIIEFKKQQSVTKWIRMIPKPKKERGETYEIKK